MLPHGKPPRDMQPLFVAGWIKVEEDSATKALYDTVCLGGLHLKCSWLPLSRFEACLLVVGN